MVSSESELSSCSVILFYDSKFEKKIPKCESETRFGIGLMDTLIPFTTVITSPNSRGLESGDGEKLYARPYNLNTRWACRHRALVRLEGRTKHSAGQSYNIEPLTSDAWCVCLRAGALPLSGLKSRAANARCSI